MRSVAAAAWTIAVGCRELGMRDLVDTSGCCEVCHSADRHAPIVFGPCQATLPDGREALVCCGIKKQLLRGSTADSGKSGGSL